MVVKEPRPRAGETLGHGHKASWEWYGCLFALLAPPGRPCARFCLLTQEALSGIAEAAGTAFASLLVSGRVVTATESWWRLGTPEAVLLPWLVGSLPPQAARDYPVYLPHGSPTVSGWVSGWARRRGGGGLGHQGTKG